MAKVLRFDIRDCKQRAVIILYYDDIASGGVLDQHGLSLVPIGRRPAASFAARSQVFCCMVRVGA